MKKVLSILLSILMVATVFQGFTVTAFAEGERDLERPNNSEHSYLDLECYGERSTLYYRGEAFNDYMPEGMSYDFETNTIYLENCDAPDLTISTSEMGYGFSICVEGNNHIKAIIANADKHANSINICGNGYLYVNDDLAFDSAPLQLNANYTDSVISIDDSVKFSVKSTTDSIIVENSNIEEAIICKDSYRYVFNNSSETESSVMAEASVLEMRTFMPIIGTDDFAAYIWDEFEQEVRLCQYVICEMIIDGKELMLANAAQDDMGNPLYVTEEDVDFATDNEIDALEFTYRTTIPLYQSEDDGAEYAISEYSFIDGANPDAATEYYWDIYKVLDTEEFGRAFYPIALQLTEEPAGFIPLTQTEFTRFSTITSDYKNYEDGEVVPGKATLTAGVKGSDCVYRDGDVIAIVKGENALIDISIRDEFGNPMVPHWYSTDMADLGFELAADPVEVDGIRYLSITNSNAKEFTTGTLTIDAFCHDTIEQPGFDTTTTEPDATFTLLINSIDGYEGCIVVGDEQAIYREGQIIPIRPGEDLIFYAWAMNYEDYNQEIIPFPYMLAVEGTGFAYDMPTEDRLGYCLNSGDLPVGTELTLPCVLLRSSDIEDHGGNPYNTPALYSFDMTFKVLDKCTDLHNYEMTYSVPPTCSGEGYNYYTCTECGNQAVNRIDALEHKLDESTVVVLEKPTCNSMGLKEGVCTVCGNTVQVSIDCLPHGKEKEVRTNVVPATCTKDGSYDVTYYCTLCGDGVRGDHVVVKATGHKYDAGKVTKAATCKATGVKTYTCTECKATKTETIAKKAHTYKNYLTKATLTANGKIVNKCSVCGVVKSTTAVPLVKTVTISAINYNYDGKVKTPAVTVKDSKGKTLRKGTDYDVTYSSGRKNVGKYAVKITLKGNYYGTKTLYFNINPKGTTIAKLTPKSKSLTVQWNKQTNQTTGYQIQYSTASNFSNAKTITMSKNTYYAKSITGLAGNKRYYVRIRTYKTVKFNGKNYNLYSPWSSAKYTTTKK